nr:hypothetical protein [Paucibacter sp. M5-1]MCZ7880471.1 hypothetical protein [Paucibacter sp. M5-1]
MAKIDRRPEVIPRSRGSAHFVCEIIVVYERIEMGRLTGSTRGGISSGSECGAFFDSLSLLQAPSWLMIGNAAAATI